MVCVVVCGVVMQLRMNMVRREEVGERRKISAELRQIGRAHV